MMVVLISKYLVPKGFRGMTLFPFVLLREKSIADDAVTMNHERIHLRQQLELLIIGFYLWYVLEFLVRWAWCGSRKLAYRDISLEREAYANEYDLTYLSRRRFWAFRKYLTAL